MDTVRLFIHRYKHIITENDNANFTIFLSRRSRQRERLNASMLSRVLPLGEFTVVISEPQVTLQGAVTWCHIAGCNNSIRHVENRFFATFHFIMFFNAVWALTSGGFRIGSVAFGVDKLEWWGYPTMKNFEDT